MLELSSENWNDFSNAFEFTNFYSGRLNAFVRAEKFCLESGESMEFHLSRIVKRKTEISDMFVIWLWMDWRNQVTKI